LSDELVWKQVPLSRIASMLLTMTVSSLGEAEGLHRPQVPRVEVDERLPSPFRALCQS